MSSEYYKELPIKIEEFQQTAQVAINYAIRMADNEEAQLLNAHILSGIINTDWQWFSFFMKQIGLDPHELKSDVDIYVKNNSKFVATGILSIIGKQFVSRQTRNSVLLAKSNAEKIQIKSTIDIQDLFFAIFEEDDGVIDNILRSRNLKKKKFRNRYLKLMVNPDFSSEDFKKQYELPPLLRQYATNLNLLAIQDRIPPLFGRENEIEQVLEILCHRERPNSPILLGEPGVGKTAIVEGLARRFVFDNGTIPARLRDCQIVNLQMNTIVAGTNLRGMFEDRIEGVIKEIKQNPHYILFIDEAHTMVGAGSALGAPSDAANMFKSVMARGEIRIIAATTLGEYKEYIEQDEAFGRRFRSVLINEPSLEETRQILKKIKPRMERNYSVKLPDEVIDLAVEMSPRYMRNLKLPDKVIGWLDTACVRAERAEKESTECDDLISVISRVAKIPKDMVSRDISQRFNLIEAFLRERVIGQEHAITAVSERLRLNKGPLKANFFQPDGVLLFLGPTGVGKTELAKALAEFLFGNDGRMIRIDMSEYQDSAAISKLIGMPRGITDSNKGGVLTNQLKDNPYSVVLLDEIEKANPELLNLFLQAFSEGWISDGYGKRVYLSDSIVIMTSNIGSEHFKRLTNSLGFRDTKSNLKDIESSVKKELEKTLSTEFINRIDEVVIFHPLSEAETSQITSKIIGEIRERMTKYHKILEIEPSVLEALGKVGYSLLFGARFLKRTIEDLVKMPINRKWKTAKLFRVLLKDDKIEVETDNGESEIVRDENNQLQT